MRSKRRDKLQGRQAQAAGNASDKRLLAKAVREHQAGNLAQAEQLYRCILRQDPGHADALNLLGALAVQDGRPDVAIDCIGRALRIDGANPTYHYNLGLGYQGAGNREAAIASYRQALHYRPDYVTALVNLGGLLFNKGETEDALACYRNAVRLAPENAMAQANLGTGLLAREQWGEAILCFRKALQVKPGYADAHNGLSAAFLAKELYGEAASSAKEALKYDPRHIQAHNNLGLAQTGNGDFEPAIITFQAALQLDPNFATALENLAEVYSARNEFDAALQIYDRILDEDPDCDRALIGRASILPIIGQIEAAYTIVRRLRDANNLSPDGAIVFGELAVVSGKNSKIPDLRDEAVEVLEKALDSPSLPSPKRSSLHFGLGKLYDGRGAFDEAFHHFHEGNALRPAPFDPQENAAAIDQQIAFYSQERLARLPPAANRSELPVFIVGMPRSGTSLVEQILACHPDVVGAGELSDFGDIVKSLRDTPGSNGPGSNDPGSSMPGSRHLRTLSQNAANAAADRYIERLHGLAGEAVRVTDKMPYNYRHLGLISLLLPHARIIHCLRDPLDTCLSCYFQNFRVRNFHTFDLGHLGAFYVQYDRLMRHWRRVLDIPMLEVRYEDHVAEPERTCREMLAFLDLEWDPQCLRFHQSKRVVRTASRDQVREPIYTRSVGRWRNYERHLGPLKEALAEVL